VVASVWRDSPRMQENQPSRTSIYAAIFRALHQTVDEDPKILADWIASRLIDVSSGDYQVRLAECDQPRARVARSNIVLRGRYAEDCLSEAIARGVRQFLVLGAGLETFAYRQPPWASALQIFEADHPATQAWKKEKLAMAGIIPPPNLTFVPIEFEATSLREGLCATGFDLTVPTFTAWLGVAYYLTEEAIDKTFQFVCRLPKGSEIVFTFAVSLDILAQAEAERATSYATAATTQSSEPWLSRFRPAQLVTTLRRIGFSRVEHFTPEQARQRYFIERGDGLAGLDGGQVTQLMRAIV
jgi:methyltransferase (TIGR00027 family)